tara:strand:+ start:42250 stop:44505 length:2256 start_codon:yes stop_codon:yes gene_type:complete
MNINQIIAQDLSVKESQVNAAVELLDEGATVPFISRYRKEVTGGLDDTQLRHLEERLTYLREMDARRETILASITEQEKLTPELKKQILAADTKARLEDLYLPYKQKRRTKAQIAKEVGLEPLADSLLGNPAQEPEVVAAEYVNKDVEDVKAALEGARHILMERFAEDADLINTLREYTWKNAVLTSQVQKDKEEAGAKFKDYFDYQEPLLKVPSHRALAIFRGQKEGFLRGTIEFVEDNGTDYCVQKIANLAGFRAANQPADAWLTQVMEWTWKIKLKLKIDVDLLMRLREAAEESAINVFKENLTHLLMAAPAGKKITLGLDPGFRTGVKTVVIDDTGKLLAKAVIFPHAPQKQWDKSLAELASLCKKFNVNLISIGNGTASRETDKLANELLKLLPEQKMTSIVVSEAGASVYSASELAAKEFPDLDVTFRGAVSIARRLQDPLAELVKIDPKAIGVGQYQHDVNQIKLGRSLDAVLEDCVNAVGADINTASVPLLKSIAGLNETIANNIIQYRETHGRFANRDSIKQVPRLGDKTYEQAIGFLRIIGGDNPLDASAVHPESYGIVDQMMKKNNVTIKDAMGNAKFITGIKASDYVTSEVGDITIRDILDELKKPGRDPRPEFKTATFKEGIEKVTDLKTNMKLEGVVTNVTNFGAFVDIGVHQDGLVHISQLADTFVEDPNKVVKAGQIVQVTVLEVDVKRNRIQLTMKKGAAPAAAGANKAKPKKAPAKPKPATGFGDLLAKAMKG